jgi:hypothetical protein
LGVGTPNGPTFWELELQKKKNPWGDLGVIPPINGSWKDTNSKRNMYLELGYHIVLCDIYLRPTAVDI